MQFFCEIATSKCLCKRKRAFRCRQKAFFKGRARREAACAPVLRTARKRNICPLTQPLAALPRPDARQSVTGWATFISRHPALNQRRFSKLDFLRKTATTTQYQF